MRFYPLFAAFAITLLSAHSVMAKPDAPKMVGKVFSIQGEADIMRGDALHKVAKGTDIFPNDTVATKQGSIVEIRFDDLSVITIGSDATLTIDAFVYSPKTPANNQSTLRVTSGFFHFVSGKLKREQVRLETPVSTIGIRGTELAGEVEESGKTAVSLGKCCVDLKTDSGTIELHQVGTYSEVSSSQAAPSAPIPTPDAWAKKAVASLGKSYEMLGLKEPENASDAVKPDKADDTPAENRFELGPDNRKSFPKID